MLSNIKKYFFFLISIILVCVIFETFSYLILKYFTNYGTYRYFKPNYLFDPILGKRHNINVDEFGNTPSVIENNFISDEFGRHITPIKNDSPELIILFTGGSTVVGSENNNVSNTIPSIIERKLNLDHNLNAEVINLGVTGYTSYQEMMAVYNFFLKYDEKIDLIFSLSGYNDVTADFDYWKFSRPDYFKSHNYVPEYNMIFDISYYDRLEVLKKLEDGEFIIFNTIKTLRKKIYTLELMDRILTKFITIYDNKINQNLDYTKTINSLKKFKKGDLIFSDKQIKLKTNLGLANYTFINELAKINNAKYYLFLQPSLLTRKDKEFSNYYNLRENIDQNYYDDRKYNLDNIYDQLVSKLNIEYFTDGRTFFDYNKKQIYNDWIHYNDYGNEVLADHFVTIVLQSIKNK